MMWWVGILKFHGLYLWCGRCFNGWCCSRVRYIQTCHGSKRLIFSGLFCHSNLSSDIETSYENPTIETNYEYLRGDIETSITCHEGFSTVGHDPPASQGLWSPFSRIVSHSRPRQATAQSGTGRHTELMIPIARAWEADSLRCASWLCRNGQVYQSPHLWL